MRLAAIGGHAGRARRQRLDRQSAPAKGPCGSRAGTPAHVSHVIWIWFENHAAGEIVGNPAAPRINRLAGECGFAAQLLRRRAPFTARTTSRHVGRHAGSHRRRPALRTPPPRASLFAQAASAAQLRGEHAGAVRPDRRLPLRDEAQPRGVLPRRPRALSHGRRAARDDEARRASRPHSRTARCRRSASSRRTSATTCTTARWRPATPGSARGSRRSRAARATGPGHTVVFVVVGRGRRLGRQPRAAARDLALDHGREPAAATRFTHYSLLRTTEELLGSTPIWATPRRRPSLRSAFGL